MARKSRQVETRMIAEYLKEYYSSFSFIMDCPLGKVPEDLQREIGYKRALGLTRPFRPIVDAVVILPRHLLLIEAKVWQVLPGMAKLPFYASLVPFTPELRQYLPRQTLLQLVVGQTNDNLAIMATSHDIAIKVYDPPWLHEVVESMNKYWTKEYREKRDAKIRMREALGLE